MKLNIWNTQWNTKTNVIASKLDIHMLIKEQLIYDPNGKCTNAFQVLSDPRLMKAAYELIKSNPGNMTKGVDKITLDRISLDWVGKASEALRTESYRPKPARRIYIPKSNGKMRPLGISSPSDKVIQQAMKLILETVLEPIFLNSSHGFRPKRGCHTALKEIRNWKGSSWFVEGEIKGFFDNIDLNIIEGLLKNHFEEARFFHLYWKFARAGYIDWDVSKITVIAPVAGVPQGGIISPILSNLILHELDLHMEKLTNSYELASKGAKPYLTNPKYHNLTMKISRMKKKMTVMDKSDSISNTAMLRNWMKQRRRLKSLVPNPKFIQIRYVRYADDWIVGVWGRKETAMKMKADASILLSKLKLELSPEKTLITNAREKRAKFLGTFIKSMASNKSPLSIRMYNNGKRRVPTGNLWMTAPILELVNKLVEKGFLTKEGSRWNVHSIGKYTVLPVKDIILKYLAIMNGIANYYSFADNRARLNKVLWILKESLRKTISRKYKLNKKSFLARYGKNIKRSTKDKKGTIKITSFVAPELKRTPMKFLGAKKFYDPFSIIDWKISTISSLDLPCASCGTAENVEMHHLRHIRTINVKLNTFDKLLARVNRKQVPLCRNCHMDVHAGRYKGKSLKYLASKGQTKEDRV